jgi:protein SCO1/2
MREDAAKNRSLKAAVAAAGISLIAAITALAVSALSPTAKATTERFAMGSQPVSSASLYQLGSQWTTDGNQKIRLRALQGRVQVLAMIFTRCPSACPTLVKEIKSLAARLPREAATSAHFVLVSIDPDFDTPEALARYREKMDLDVASWTLLRGEAEDVRELAAVLGVSYGKSDGMEIAHSKLITVLESGGQIVHQQTGVQPDPDRIVAAIADAAKMQTQ